MALGRAIVAPDQPNIREVLADGETALLFRPDDSQHLCAQIARLCGDPALRQRLGDAASRRIDEGGYVWDDNARRVLAESRDTDGRGAARSSGFLQSRSRETA